MTAFAIRNWLDHYWLYLAGLCCAAVILVARLWFFGSDHYEQCIVDEMRGQQLFVYAHVEQLCANRYGKEVPIASDEVSFRYSVEDISNTAPRLPPSLSLVTELYDVTIAPESAPPDYELTRADLWFSPRPCEQSRYEDFAVKKILDFDSTSNSFHFYQEEYLGCMHVEEVWGRYKHWWYRWIGL